MMADPVIAAQIGVGALQDVLFALAIGSLACDAALVPPQGQSREPTIERHLALVRLISVLTLTGLHGVYLWLQTAAMSGLSPVEARAALIAVVTQSHFGSVWLIALSGLLIAVFGAASHTFGGRAAVALGLALYLAGKVGATHAADAGNFSVPEFVHLLHVWATAWWAGSVVLANLVLRAISAAPRGVMSRHLAFAEHLSFSATVALACVIATGIYNAAHVLARTSAPLMQTPYGRLLIIKIALVVLATMLGALNRIVRLPKLRDASALTSAASRLDGAGERAYSNTAGAFNRTITLEAFTLLLVLAVAALLAHTSPIEG